MKIKIIEVVAKLALVLGLLATSNASATGYTLTVSAQGDGTIFEYPTNPIYPSGSVVVLVASNNPGWLFASWSGDATGSMNPLNVAMTSNLVITGNFVELPAFDMQPVSVTNIVGSSVSFYVHSVGTAPLAYQWFFAGSPLNAATNSALVLTNVSTGQVGNYWIVASNNYGSVTSLVVSLTLTNVVGLTNLINSADEASLRAAIQIGGWVGFSVSGTITITNTICITNNVFLDGRNVAITIDGGNAVRLFYVVPGVTFGVTNLTLANGSCIIVTNFPGTNADGGAIYNDGGTVTLVGCTLTNNSAQALIVGGAGRGGAIFNNGGFVTLCQSTILNCLALGGGLNSPLPLPTNNNPITVINTALGGAIYNVGGAMAITGCTLSSNLCQNFIEYNYDNYGLGLAMGGAVFQASGSVGITNSSFVLNQTVGGDGGFFEFTRPSPAYGGALAATGGILSIDHGRFRLNQALGGAATDSIEDFSGDGGVAYGGAIYCASMARFCDSSFFGNQASAGYGDNRAASGCGGGVCNAGNLELIHCAIYSNSVVGGAGIPFNGGVPSAGGDALGGGIFNMAQLAITNCTIALNSCTAGRGSDTYNGPEGSDFYGANGSALGAGTYNTDGTLFLMNVTVASNSCTAKGVTPTNGLAAGAEVANVNGTLGLHNSIVAYSGTNANAYGFITDNGFNICSDGSANLFGGSSFNYTDPQLAPLADYGGPTLCMALLPTSPAIDYGDPADFPTTDQRGFFRPVGAGPDIGAYEFGSFPLVIPTLVISATASNALLSFTASMPTAYCLQTSTNLTSWSNLETNGPFASATNVIQSVNQQGLNRQYFRLLVQ